jgi:hypothetical protein
MRVCAHCGELYPDGRLNCPHCGADADLTWSQDEPPHETYEGWSEKDDAEYQAFLEREGLLDAPAPPRSRRRLWVILLALLLAASISGIVAILL